MSDPLWYKDAVIYEAHVRAFFDSNNDGIGDFPGLTSKLDYLQSLGVNALWLLPFYPSPLRDDGYDIADYEGIHPSYGTIQDFERFMDEAHRRGIRVITELVVNHTSDQHPWFQRARRAPAGSPERAFYVWSETNQKYQNVRIIFTDTETSNWSWDDTAKAYYWHRFFHHQPDLNFDNPHVLESVLNVMRFWLDRGVDGLRLDAVPYLIEREGTICENLDETHEILRVIRRALDERYSDRMLIAEANQWPADVRPYFGDGDECHMAFNFPLMPRMFMALRQEDRHPITEILRQTPEIPDNCQWGLFLRNHDELTLEMVTDEERDYMYQSYAADPQMRINVGIRRRLAPLMENSRRRTELLNSLLFSLPGTPVIYYGDEIGMGDNIYLGDRNGVRTPMQWTGDRNAGFSRADPARLFAPLIMDPVYGYQSINVEAQERAPYSLLNWMKRMIGLRKQFKVFGRGTLEFLPSSNRKVLPYVRMYEGELVLCIANLSRSVQPIELDLSRFKGLTPTEMLGLTEFPRIGELPYFLTLGPYAFYWFRLQQTPAPIAARLAPDVHDSTPTESLPAFFMGVAWDTLLDGNVRTLIEREALIPFLQRQRWFGGKARPLRAARLVDWGLLRRGHQPLFLTVVEVEYVDGARERYFVPLAVATEAQADAVSHGSPHLALARVTGARKGLVVDAAADESFGPTLLDTFDRDAELRTKRGLIRVRQTSAFVKLRRKGSPPARRMPGEQSNTSIAFGYRLIAKLFRRIEPGPNPEVEIGEQLTTRTSFTRVPRVAAFIEYEQTAERPTHMAVLQEFVPSQADGWSHALDELRRYFDETDGRGVPAREWMAATSGFDLIGTPIPGGMCDVAGAYFDSARVLGRRTAELHLALAQDSTSEAFVPQPFTRADIDALASGAAAEARHSLDLLERNVDALAPAVAADARALIRRVDDILRHVQEKRGALELTTAAIRIHGDYHLGQVLWSEGDYYLIDFEGEPARPIEIRRRRQSPLKDVAGMLRSFSYAAYAALFERAGNRPADMERLEPWTTVWQLWTSASFLTGYFETAGDAPFLPGDRVQRAALLDLFLLDKAFYELDYELNSRPDWVRIPLRGIKELLRE
ncbi:MAG TPA: maltose alpha-D-glucosyltransferase [Vicinamibacterales bacterium]|jgi:maltose alpha-D-glucosyltransferase/alpha-amylase|nr:maltose alpha-D-glucosyltransferase [Vicinamibacterales bacterium]